MYIKVQTAVSIAWVWVQNFLQLISSYGPSVSTVAPDSAFKANKGEVSIVFFSPLEFCLGGSQPEETWSVWLSSH